MCCLYSKYKNCDAGKRVETCACPQVTPEARMLQISLLMAAFLLADSVPGIVRVLPLERLGTICGKRPSLVLLVTPALSFLRQLKTSVMQNKRFQ